MFAVADEPGRPLAAANQSLESSKGRGLLDLARQRLTGAREGYPRAPSTRYGAAGAAAATLIDAGVRAARGQHVSAGQVATATATHAAVGGGAAKAVDLLAPRVGLVKAGGAVGAVVQASASGYSNVQAYRAGEISGSRAVVGFGVGVGAHYAIGQLDKVTGFTSAAKDALTSGIDSVTSGAASAWHKLTPW